MAKKLELEDVKPRIITVVVESVEMGKVWEADIALPTLAEWNNAQFGINFPNLSDYSKQRMKNGQKEDYFDTNDPEYLRLRELAFEETNMRRVTKALLGAGNFPKLASLSLPEATAKLIETADRDFLRGVHAALIKVINDTRGGVEAKKEAFPAIALPAESNEPLLIKAVES